MSEAKHTPGPWVLGDENNQSCSVLLGAEHNLVACLDRQCSITGQMVISRDEMLANAHLIIAAPYLLKAAKAALQVFVNQGWEDDLLAAKELSAAIAKATGGAA